MNMEPIISPVDRKAILRELTPDRFIRETRKGGNELYEITAAEAPETMREIGRLREMSFRMAGGGTGKALDIDPFDTDPENPYRQLIVWDPKDEEIIGGYRYLIGEGIDPKKLATYELFRFSDRFLQEYLPQTIELGRSFIQPNYQGTNIRSKGLFSLDNLWDGLGALMLKYDRCRYFFGKVTMYHSYDTEARNILLHFLHHFFEDREQLVAPIEPLDYDAQNRSFSSLFEGKDYRDAYRDLQRILKEHGEFIPPLINSYMNLSPSLRIFGTAVNHGFGEVEETGILISIPDIYPDKVERHLKPLEHLKKAARRLRPKWWR